MNGTSDGAVVSDGGRDEAHDDATMDVVIEAARRDERSEANRMIGMGVGIGAFGAATALLAGAVCPACVVAAPALVGVGLFRRRRARRSDG